jgi:hypothetical protein
MITKNLSWGFLEKLRQTAKISGVFYGSNPNSKIAKNND